MSAVLISIRTTSSFLKELLTQRTQRLSLKKNAIPRVQQVAMDRLKVRLFAYLLRYILFKIGVGEDASGNKAISPGSPNFIEKVKDDLVSCPGGLTSIYSV